MKTTDTRFTDFYSALHAGPATADRVTTYNLLKFLHRLCRVRVSVLPIISCSARTKHRADPRPPLSSQAPAGPAHLARVQHQTASNTRKYEIISPLCVAGHLSARHSRSALRGLSEARKSRRCGSNYPGPGHYRGPVTRPGCLLCFTSPSGHTQQMTPQQIHVCGNEKNSI